jgi:hypothetical protein
LQHGVAYYFHDYFTPGTATRVVSAKFPDMMSDGEYKSVAGFTGPDVRAREVTGVEFPTLLEPVDDLPPATMITSVRASKGKRIVRGVAHDNGEIAAVTVNGRPAKILSAESGVATWEIILDGPRDGAVVAKSIDKAGNEEQTTAQWVAGQAAGTVDGVKALAKK